MSEELNEAAKKIVGSVYLPRSPGTSVGKFKFVVGDPTRDYDSEEPDWSDEVEIDSLVTAETREGIAVGAVVDMETIGSHLNPIDADLSAAAAHDIGSEQVELPESMVGEVQVFYSDSKKTNRAMLRPVTSGSVRAATAEELKKATGQDSQVYPIPAGLVKMIGGELGVATMDLTLIAGPEAAHMMVSGISGMATKSSFLNFVVKSLMTHGNKSGIDGNKKHSAAAVYFNVKGDNFLYMDEPPLPGREPSPEDLSMYKTAGIPAEPFPSKDKDGTKLFRVMAPGLPKAVPGSPGTRSPRADAEPLRWDLEDIWGYLYVLLGTEINMDEKLQSFFAEFKSFMLYNPDPDKRINTFDRLDAFWTTYLDEPRRINQQDPEAKVKEGWRSHHPMTMDRIRRMLDGMVSRTGGLITRQAAEETGKEDIWTSGWRHGQVLVVDVAGLDVDVQGLVIARISKLLMYSAQAGHLGVDHLILIADELNSYAPSSGVEMSSVRRALKDVATQGRSHGVSLWGAMQNPSKVHDEIVSNAPNAAIGRSDPIELSTGSLGRLSNGMYERLATLPKGFMALKHASYRGLLVVRFPRPAWCDGKSDTPQYRATSLETLGMTPKSLEALLEGTPTDIAERIIAGEDDPIKAIEALKKARVPDMSKITVVPDTSDFDPTNPFNIEDLD